jgi:hypothetical protein
MITSGAVSAPLLPHHRRVKPETRHSGRLCRGPGVPPDSTGAASAMATIIIMIIAILVLLVIAELPYFSNRSHSAAERPMTIDQYDYYHYIRNH